jgi:hypothetical protein
MHIWNEIKRYSIYIGFQLFDLYVDLYIWINKQDFIKYIFPIKLKHIEPESAEWISICSMYNNDDKYDICNTYLENENTIDEQYILFCNRKEPCNKTNRKEHLFLAKQNNQYFTRTYFSDKNNIEIMKSNIKFTYIEYSHPKMRNMIELKIPSSMYMVGNELFTPVFVLRLLTYQSNNYYFDLEYKISILDNEIKTIELTSDLFIVLDKDTYHIHSI